MANRRLRFWLTTAAVTLAVAIAAIVLFARPASAPAPTTATVSPALQTASQGLDEIAIDATFQPVNRTLTVSQVCTLANRTGETQRLVTLRTYPNVFASSDTSPAATDEYFDACYPKGFSAGELTFSVVKLRMGQSEEIYANYRFADDAHTVMQVTLPSDWAPGDTLTLRMAYTLLVPEAAYRYGVDGGVWTLGNAFVIPSPWMDGEYRSDPYISIGDPFLSECRNYTVRLTAPSDYAVGGTGQRQSAPAENGQTLTTFSAPAVRDFALCLSTQYREKSITQNGVLLRALALSDGNAQKLLDTAAKALVCYSALYGAYPYPTYTLCEVSFPFGGMEYPTMVMISSAYLKTGGDKLEQTIAHETAHQWWYAVVGSDEFNQPWQDEALCQFSLLDYWESRYGAAARADLKYSLADTAMLVTIPAGVTPGSPVDYFGDMSEYVTVVYGRGAAAMCALDTAMKGGLDGFLKDYYATYAFKLATRTDFETLLKAYTGEDWSPLLSDYLDTYLNN